MHVGPCLILRNFPAGPKCLRERGAGEVRILILKYVCIDDLTLQHLPRTQNFGCLLYITLSCPTGRLVNRQAQERGVAGAALLQASKAGGPRVASCGRRAEGVDAMRAAEVERCAAKVNPFRVASRRSSRVHPSLFRALCFGVPLGAQHHPTKPNMTLTSDEKIVVGSQ